MDRTASRIFTAATSGVTGRGLRTTFRLTCPAHESNVQYCLTPRMLMSRVQTTSSVLAFSVWNRGFGSPHAGHSGPSPLYWYVNHGGGRALNARTSNRISPVGRAATSCTPDIAAASSRVYIWSDSVGLAACDSLFRHRNT